MKKIVCFGDSFIDSTSWFGKNASSISTMLQQKLNIPLVNYGLVGSSIQYSLLKFLEYTKSEIYDPNDLILFVITNKNRFYKQDLDIHISGVRQTPHIINDYKSKVTNPNLTDTEVRLFYQKILYLEENEKYIDWSCMHFNEFDIDIESLTCLGLLNTWATSKTNKLIVMNAFALDNNTWDQSSVFKQSANFLPILLKGGLKKYSVNEFIDKEISSLNWQEECRINHFSPDNREIISDMLVKVISHNDSSVFDTELINTSMYNDFVDIKIKYGLVPHQFI